MKTSICFGDLLDTNVTVVRISPEILPGPEHEQLIIDSVREKFGEYIEILKIEPVIHGYRDVFARYNKYAVTFLSPKKG